MCQRSRRRSDGVERVAVRSQCCCLSVGRRVRVGRLAAPLQRRCLPLWRYVPDGPLPSMVQGVMTRAWVSSRAQHVVCAARWSAHRHHSGRHGRLREEQRRRTARCSGSARLLDVHCGAQRDAPRRQQPSIHVRFVTTRNVTCTTSEGLHPGTEWSRITRQQCSQFFRLCVLLVCCRLVNVRVAAFLSLFLFLVSRHVVTRRPAGRHRPPPAAASPCATS
jgi:hypothetical protein